MTAYKIDRPCRWPYERPGAAQRDGLLPAAPAVHTCAHRRAVHTLTPRRLDPPWLLRRRHI